MPRLTPQGSSFSRARSSTVQCGALHAIIDPVTHVLHVPYVVEQDEDGGWHASAYLRLGVAAFGEGATQEAAIADLRAGLELLIEEVGIPDELTLTINVA